VIFLWLATLLPVLYWDAGPETAAVLQKAGITHIAVPPALESQWKRLKGVSTSVVDIKGLTEAPVPSIQRNLNEASATRRPWIDSNGWRFLREPKARFYTKAPGAAAALAAAEAFVFGVESFVQTDEAGLEPLRRMIEFLRQIEDLKLPERANIGFIDDGSEESGEIMNLMIRKNLLFRIVAAPDSSLDLNVRPGSKEYPVAGGFDPEATAQKIRSELTDARRFLRIYGSEVVIARIAGNQKQVRVYLLNYGGSSRSVSDVRLRVLGRYPRHRITMFGTPQVEPLDYVADTQSTELTIPKLTAFTVVDLLAGP